jgi:hypothetical protein
MANKNSPLKDFHHLTTKEEKLDFQKAVEAIYQQKGKLPDKWFWVKENDIYFYIEQNNGTRRLSNIQICAICERKFAVRLSEKNNIFCSRECHSQSSKEKFSLSCGYCKNPVFRTAYRYSKSRSGLVFCDRQCKDNSTKLENGITKVWPKHYGKKETKEVKNKKTKIRKFSKILNVRKEDIVGNFSYVYFAQCKKCPQWYTSHYQQKVYCNECIKINYKLYKFASTFKFKQKDHPHLFNDKLIKKYGWYQPTNTKSGQPNLNGLSWDHLFRVEEGFKLGISPEIMSHPANAELVPHSINQKRRKSMINYDELLLRIEKYNNQDYDLTYFFKDKSDD